MSEWIWMSATLHNGVNYFEINHICLGIFQKYQPIFVVIDVILVFLCVFYTLCVLHSL